MSEITANIVGKPLLGTMPSRLCSFWFAMYFGCRMPRWTFLPGFLAWFVHKADNSNSKGTQIKFGVVSRRNDRQIGHYLWWRPLFLTMPQRIGSFGRFFVLGSMSHKLFWRCRVVLEAFCIPRVDCSVVSSGLDIYGRARMRRNGCQCFKSSPSHKQWVFRYNECAVGHSCTCDCLCSGIGSLSSVALDGTRSQSCIALGNYIAIATLKYSFTKVAAQQIHVSQICLSISHSTTRSSEVVDIIS